MDLPTDAPLGLVVQVFDPLAKQVVVEIEFLDPGVQVFAFTFG